MTTTEDAIPVEAALPPEPPSPPPEPLAPVGASERIETLDILRGLALFGILAANIRGFAGPALTYFMPHLYYTKFGDRLAQAFIDTFVQGKFITLFAVMFGVGFGVQLERSMSREGRFGWTYARRLFVLLLFGLVHGLLIWWGDILLVYALIGFILLLFRKRKDKTLIIWAIAGYSVPILLTIAAFTATQLGYAPPPFPEPSAAQLQELTTKFASGSWPEIQMQRMKDVLTRNWGLFPIMMWQILALFLTGVLLWRRRLFHPTPESLPKYRTAMWVGFAIGVPGNLAVTTTRWLLDLSPMPTTPLAALTNVLQFVSIPCLSLGYLCLVILLCNDDVWLARLRRFGAVGRTALSNYLLQSVIGTLIFYSYGLGLFGKVGPAILLIFTVVIYGLLVLASEWWLTRYRFGPVEWLWRSLTYKKRFPMVRESVLESPLPAARGEG